MKPYESIEFISKTTMSNPNHLYVIMMDKSIIYPVYRLKGKTLKSNYIVYSNGCKQKCKYNVQWNMIKAVLRGKFLLSYINKNI